MEGVKSLAILLWYLMSDPLGGILEWAMTLLSWLSQTYLYLHLCVVSSLFITAKAVAVAAGPTEVAVESVLLRIGKARGKIPQT